MPHQETPHQAAKRRVHPKVAEKRALVGGLSRAVNNGERPDNGELNSAKAELAEAKIEAYVEKILSEAPPLTTEQRTRLAELLRPVRIGGAAA